MDSTDKTTTVRAMSESQLTHLAAKSLKIMESVVWHRQRSQLLSRCVANWVKIKNNQVTSILNPWRLSVQCLKTLPEAWFSLAHKHKPGRQKHGDTARVLQTSLKWRKEAEVTSLFPRQKMHWMIRYGKCLKETVRKLGYLTFLPAPQIKIPVAS